MADNRQTSTVDLFSISPARLALLSVLTIGLYEIYWFYRNWKALKGIDPEVKHPFWRAVFTVFYCYSLFKKVLGAAKKLNYKGAYNPGPLATTYIILLLIGDGWGRASNLDKDTDITLMIVSLLSFVPLLYIQRALNFIAGRHHSKRKFRPTVGEVLVVIIGFVIFLTSLYVVFGTKHLTLDQQNQANELKTKSDSLYSQYQSCANSLNQRYNTLDNTNQEAVDSYNADYNSCESLRTQQNQAAADYNNIVR